MLLILSDNCCSLFISQSWCSNSLFSLRRNCRVSFSMGNLGTEGGGGGVVDMRALSLFLKNLCPKSTSKPQVIALGLPKG